MQRKHTLSIGMGIAAFLGVLVALGADPTALLGSIQDGLDQLQGEIDVPTGTTTDIRITIIEVINFVLSFLALIAVAVIIAAGFVLILGLGSEASGQRARKIIIYTIIGLIVIFFASVIVSFFTEELSSRF